jgi:hypothetical protein
MSALLIIGIVIGIIVFFIIGFVLWSYSKENYDHNIFGWGVLLRGLASYVLAYMTLGAQGEDFIVLWSCIGILWLWTFLVTMFRTNIFIAIFSLVYQVVAVVIVKIILEKIFGSSED